MIGIALLGFSIMLSLILMTFQNKAQNHFFNLKRNQIQHKDATIISFMGTKTIPNPKLSSLFLCGEGDKEKSSRILNFLCKGREPKNVLHQSI